MKTTISNPMIKDTVTFLQTSASSGGKITEMELTLHAGGGNPLHHHGYPETFTAIHGDLGLRLGKKHQKILRTGESFTVLPGSLHCFFNPTDREIRFSVQVEPASQGLEYFLRILYGLAEDGLTDQTSKPRSIKHTAFLLCMGDVHVPGFIALIYPLLKLLAKRAKANGDEQKLVEKYCV